MKTYCRVAPFLGCAPSVRAELLEQAFPLNPCHANSDSGALAARPWALQAITPQRRTANTPCRLRDATGAKLSLLLASSRRATGVHTGRR